MERVAELVDAMATIGRWAHAAGGTVFEECAVDTAAEAYAHDLRVRVLPLSPSSEYLTFRHGYRVSPQVVTE